MSNLKKTTGILAVVALFVIFLLTACRKENSAVQTQTAKKLSVYLTDDPCNYDSVFIDIRYVEVKVDTSEEHMNDDHFDDQDGDQDDDHHDHDQYGKWDTLNIKAGVYNIMALRNGADTLLGTANLPKGSIRKIRVTLGTNNRVVVAGISHPLNLYPGTNNYVYIKLGDGDLDEDHHNNQVNVWLDFNVCESIVSDNGQYYLRPIIKPFGREETGEIEGRVLPNDAEAMVKAYNDSDSAIAKPEEDDGEYKIEGLTPGTYSLLFKGANGYKDTLLTNIQVQKGEETKVPLITLKK
ncbi:MAG: DUF4382 domain-containing protein [Sphingobacteriales bacterium]